MMELGYLSSNHENISKDTIDDLTFSYVTLTSMIIVSATSQASKILFICDPVFVCKKSRKS